MAKAPKSEKAKIELRPDAWERFKKAVDVALKTPAKHRASAPKKARQGAAKRKKYASP